MNASSFLIENKYKIQPKIKYFCILFSNKLCFINFSTVFRPENLKFQHLKFPQCFLFPFFFVRYFFVCLGKPIKSTLAPNKCWFHILNSNVGSQRAFVRTWKTKFNKRDILTFMHSFSLRNFIFSYEQKLHVFACASLVYTAPNYSNQRPKSNQR